VVGASCLVTQVTVDCSVACPDLLTGCSLIKFTTRTGDRIHRQTLLLPESTAVSNLMTPVSRSTQSLQPVRRSGLVGLVQRTSLVSYIVNAMRTFGTPPKPVELFRPKPNLCRKSSINIRPKTKLVETVQIVVFGAETETEFRSISKPRYCWEVLLHKSTLLAQTTSIFV